MYLFLEQQHYCYMSIGQKASSILEVFLALIRRDAILIPNFWSRTKNVKPCVNISKPTDIKIHFKMISSSHLIIGLASDVSAYITTNVISITDGQIFLSQDLLH